MLLCTRLSLCGAAAAQEPASTYNFMLQQSHLSLCGAGEIKSLQQLSISDSYALTSALAELGQLTSRQQLTILC